MEGRGLDRILGRHNVGPSRSAVVNPNSGSKHPVHYEAEREGSMARNRRVLFWRQQMDEVLRDEASTREVSGVRQTSVCRVCAEFSSHDDKPKFVGPFRRRDRMIKASVVASL